MGIDKSKRNASDFVLWFTKSKFSDQDMKWDSEYGLGYPGWHIECSAMAMKYLGKTIDMHCGGIDHIPVHHTNEIAQSEAATGKKFVRYWLHNEFLVLKNKEKMAKSQGNFLTLHDLMEKGYDPMVYRYFCLGAHYRSQLFFDFEALDGAKKSYTSLKERIRELKRDDTSKGQKGVEKYKKEFAKGVNDDLNTPKALAVLWGVMKDAKLGSKEKLRVVDDFERVLGLRLNDVEEEKIPEEVMRLAELREKAREKCDYKESDRLRDEIKKKGFRVEDAKEGFRLKRV